MELCVNLKLIDKLITSALLLAAHCTAGINEFTVTKPFAVTLPIIKLASNATPCIPNPFLAPAAIPATKILKTARFCLSKIFQIVEVLLTK